VTVSRVLAFPGAYRASLLLLGATRAMQDSEEVSWASAALGTVLGDAALAGRLRAARHQVCTRWRRVARVDLAG
jgi:hypothetical protein